MPLCVKLLDATVDGLVDAFSTVDIVLRHLAYEDDDGKLAALDPEDQDYVSPYAIVRKPSTRKRKVGEDAHQPDYWLVFTCYKIDDMHAKAHHDATITMFKSVGKQTKDRFRIFGCVQELFGGTVARKNIVAFSRFVTSGPSLELEEYAFERSCETMAVEFPADWRARRLARRTQLGFDAIEKPPLSPIPALSDSPFKPLTEEEIEANCKAHVAKLIQEKEDARLQAIENKKESDKLRLDRYMPTVDEFKDAAEPDDELCVYVFSTDFEGAKGRTKCPYDRKDGSPFCSMCSSMIAIAAAKQV